LLLLRELRKLTKDPNHPEIPHLDKAEKELNDVADDINQAIVDKERSLKLMELNELLIKDKESGETVCLRGRHAHVIAYHSWSRVHFRV
jgi:hypothetical protein